MDKTAKIRELNDRARTTFKNVQVMLALGIRARPEKEVSEILERVRTFNEFTPANNPYLENDCACFDYNGDRIIWKFDYYSSSDMQYASDDPADPNKTTRVLTIMDAAQDW